MIAPHGGALVDRVLRGAAAQAARADAAKLPRLEPRAEVLRDLENIAAGVFSPLIGPLGKADLDAVAAKGRLANGVAWTVPVLLDAPADRKDIAAGARLALAPPGAGPLGILTVTEMYPWNREQVAQGVFGTADQQHPGIAALNELSDRLIGGTVEFFDFTPNPYAAYTRTPAETRLFFAERGWETAGAFQTRNIPHAGHEYMQKVILAMCDGLMIHPVIGRKKAGDFTDEMILRCYEALLGIYFPTDRVLLNTFRTHMRYAGPKEAIFHAIVRKNYGCTHIAIGRDHAGVGKYYAPDAAIRIFDQYPELDIKPITIHGDFFYCHDCRGLGSERTCPHPAEQHISFSGTEVRAALRDGRLVPAEIVRPEVFDILASEEQPFVT